MTPLAKRNPVSTTTGSFPGRSSHTLLGSLEEPAGGFVTYTSPLRATTRSLPAIPRATTDFTPAASYATISWSCVATA